MTPNQLRALRATLGLTQHDLADKLGVRMMTVSRWERGVASPRSTALLWALERLEHTAEQVKAKEESSKARH